MKSKNAYVKTLLCGFALCATSNIFCMVQLPVKLLVARTLCSTTIPAGSATLQNLNEELQLLHYDLYKVKERLREVKALIQAKEERYLDKSSEATNGECCSEKNRKKDSNTVITYYDKPQQQKKPIRWDSSMDRQLPEEEWSPWKEEQDRTKFW
ncbi:MAG: hypothetical protein AB7F19_00305 [Candidatus Babeliales bacterium]